MSNPHSFGEDASCELYVTSGNTVQKIVGSQSGTATPGCQSAPPAATSETPSKKCVRSKKRKRGGAAAKKRRPKLCVSGSWAGRL